ncbi:MAG TPA: 3-deoxy-D-manno-octulosonic acid transferase [Pyrinomonadaceae bacterium]|jgi:3-deoxy-D-manno-octulosonic-acid transferase
MYFLYSVALTVGFILLLPRFVLDAVRHGKYAAGFRERLGRLAAPEARGRPVVWLHCVSVGETQAARPLVRSLVEQFPSHALVVSTTTLTGQRLAREVFADEAVSVFYFPFDWAWTVRRALRAVNPATVLVLETELWPRFLRECRARRIPVALVNGRISEKSFRRYKLIRSFIGRVLGDLSLAIMQSEADAERIAALGLTRERIRISGNIKFDASVEVRAEPFTDELRERFRLDDERPLIVAASTHAPEERIILEAFQKLRATLPGRAPRLLIAPRHPERFAEVVALLDSCGMSWARRSDAHAPVSDPHAEVILLDSIGELRGVYPLAALVFVGGSIAPTGGHNVLEPAAHAKCIVTGAHTSNFASIIRDFLEREALVQLPALSREDAPLALARVFQELLEDEDRRLLLGARAHDALRESRGATARTIELLADVLESASKNEDRQLPFGAHAPTNI